MSSERIMVSIETPHVAKLSPPAAPELSAAGAADWTTNDPSSSTAVVPRHRRLGTETRTMFCALLGIADMAIAAISGVSCYWLTYGVNPPLQRSMIAIIFGAVLTANYL